MSLMRNLMLKHDFDCMVAHFNDLDAMHLRTLTTIVQNITTAFACMHKLINQYHQWAIEKQILDTAPKFRKVPRVMDSINESL